MSKISIIIFSVLTTTAVAIGVVYIIATNKINKEVEQIATIINGYLEQVKTENMDIFHYVPFKCSGSFKITCSSDKITFYSDNNSINAENVKFIIKPSYNSVSLNAKSDFSIISPNHKYVANSDCNGDIVFVENRPRVKLTAQCLSNMQPFSATNDFNVYMEHEVFNSKKLLELAGKFQQDEQLLDKIIKESKYVIVGLNGSIKSDNLFQDTLSWYNNILSETELTVTEESVKNGYESTKNFYKQLLAYTSNEESIKSIYNFFNVSDKVIYENYNKVIFDIKANENNIDDLFKVFKLEYYNFDFKSEK